MKVSYIRKEGNYLLVYIKKTLFRTQYKIHKELEQFQDKYISYLGWYYEESSRYVIATFILRNTKDIKPYIEKLEEK